MDENNIGLALLTTIIGAVIGAVINNYFNNENKEEINTHKKKLSDLQSEKNKVMEKYEKVKKALGDSGVINTHTQTVILCGPRAIGKTSLMMQWYAPWEHISLSATSEHKRSNVPVFEYEGDRAPHFADPSISARQTHQIVLDVHDFPGELSAQMKVREQIIKNSQNHHGVVIVCMLDAMDAVNKKLSGSINEYYNGELFKGLRSMVATSNVDIRRVVLVFNKFDLLLSSLPTINRNILLDRCIETYSPIIELFKGVVNRERICEVVTILNREEMKTNNMGAPIVKGECIRDIYFRLRGGIEVNKVIPEGGTTKSSRYL